MRIILDNSFLIAQDDKLYRIRELCIKTEASHNKWQ